MYQWKDFEIRSEFDESIKLEIWWLTFCTPRYVADIKQACGGAKQRNIDRKARTDWQICCKTVVLIVVLVVVVAGAASLSTNATYM